MKLSLDFKNDFGNSILTCSIIVIVILIIIAAISLLFKENKSDPVLILESKNITLAAGDIQEIKYKLKNIDHVDVSFSSKNVAIAVVSNNGMVTGVSPGSTYIVMNYSLKDGSSYSNLIFVSFN